MQTTTTHMTPTDAIAAVETMKAVADAIRSLGEVPSGHLYANLVGQLSLAQFEQIIGILKRAGLVREKGHLLTWLEPEATA